MKKNRTYGLSKREKALLITASFVFLAIIVLNLPARGQQDMSGACDSAGCHDQMGKMQVVHPALDPKDCSNCHEKTGDHQFKLVSEQPELCYMCHEKAKGKTAHGAIDAGGCTTCHDPHQSDYPRMMKKPLPFVCWDCHDKFPSAKAGHLPVNQGECYKCHDPHASDNPKMLKQNPPGLCRNCHKDLTTPIPEETIKPIPPHGAGRPTGPLKMHVPVESGECLTCHAPHGTNNEGMLLNPQFDLCSMCHDIPTEAKQAKYPHPPAKEGTCAKCHSPHESHYPKLLRDDLINVCGQCHISIVSGGKSVHPPVQEGECATCHKPHGSDQRRLLVSPPKDLCLNCHEPMTNYPVVHGAVVLGKCATCHNPHRSEAPHLVRDTKISDTCFRCHYDDVTKRKVVHPPVAEGECTACHAPHGSANEKLTVLPGKQVCFQCHDETMLEGASVHGVINQRGCTACHDPHGTANPRMLIEMPNKLCLSCHQKIATYNHIPLQGLSAKGHPLDTVLDPSRPGQVMSCIACHSPHAGKGPKLLQEGPDTFSICGRCHKQLR